jgi:hypothetical protein
MNIADIFFSEYAKFKKAKGLQSPSETPDKLDSKLQESLSVLREVMKSELFFSSPRFQIERFKYRRKWKAFMQEHKK